MPATITSAIPILPAANTAASLAWWTTLCGFTETFRDATPPTYSGIVCHGTHMHISQMSDPVLARTVGDQTMLRLVVDDLHAFHAEFLARGGALHPNSTLERKPWGTLEFAAIDPNGICVTFQQQ
jgi:uncharacterized glyoxalase superfamily protein PhnB